MYNFWTVEWVHERRAFFAFLQKLSICIETSSPDAGFSVPTQIRTHEKRVGAIVFNDIAVIAIINADFKPFFLQSTIVLLALSEIVANQLKSMFTEGSKFQRSQF